MRVLGISGSLRRDSHNSELLRAAAPLLPPGAELEVFDGLKAIPPYDADDDVEPAPEPVRELREAIDAADAVFVATPEYNASIPGVLKNALDWASRPHATNVLRGKPVAVVGASTGMFGAVWAQAEARKVLATIGARVIDRELPVSEAPERFGAGGLADADVEGVLAEITGELVGAAEAREALVTERRFVRDRVAS
jgi:chromate reductase, NAD(P)H dehydrogenase (quinone)